MEFLKSATILRKFYEENKQSEYIFSETDFETVSYPDLYRAAAKLACHVGLSNLKDVEIAILGRWSSFTIQAFVSLLVKSNKLRCENMRQYFKNVRGYFIITNKIT